MSWTGSGGISRAPIRRKSDTAASAPVDPPSRRRAVSPVADELAALRRRVRDVYGKGLIDQASDAQSKLLVIAARTGAATVDDFLFAALIHHATHRIADGIAVVRQGLQLYPENASLHENLGVMLLAARDIPGCITACQAALTLGSVSPNVHDCLCDAYQRGGRLDLSTQAGRMALEAKDRRFGAAVPIVMVPKTRPPVFNPGWRDHNIIAYTLWGNDQRYHVPLLENARIQPHLFPEWTIRVYHDKAVDPAYLARLATHGVQLRPMALPPDVPAQRALLWRFEVIADTTVSRFLVRDADALLTVKERVAVDAWLRSDFHFHAMRDWYTHTDLLLAGMWGGVGAILPPPATLMRAYTSWRMENNHVDQDLLSETVWPIIRNSVLIHDSIFQPCLGSMPFPPFGDLPPGHSIGQNAFLHFSKPS